MSRRYLTAGLSLAVLLGAQSGLGRVNAKPPDLPIVENDALISAPVFAAESETPAPSAEIPALFQLRPSVRRMAATCILFGVHPLLALAPTEEYLDSDLDDYAPADPSSLPFPMHSSPPSGIVTYPSFQIYHDSSCPFIRQQQSAPDRHLALFADPDFSRDVIQNLEALSKSRELVEKARELGRNGRATEAIGALRVAADMCPGGRFDAEIQAATSEIRENANQVQHEMDQKLSQPVTLSFTDASLRQVIDDLRGWTDANIYVDVAALDAQEVSLEHPVTIKVQNIPLRSALDLVVKQAHLTYVIKDEVVQITTEHSQHAGIEPTLPPVDANVPTALDQLLSDTRKLGMAVVGFASEEQEPPADSRPHVAMEFGFGSDGGFRMFTQFIRGGAVWHFEYNTNGFSWWTAPNGAADAAPVNDSGD